MNWVFVFPLSKAAFLALYYSYVFPCYINDFYAATSLYSVLFADDTTSLSKGKNLNELILYTNQELCSTVQQQWAWVTSRSQSDLSNWKNIQWGPRKLLGVLFDEYPSFKPHISHICSKISKSLFCINRIKNFVNQDFLKKLYYAKIHSHLTYCLNVYSCANTINLQRLRIKQKEAIRVINNAW